MADALVMTKDGGEPISERQWIGVVGRLFLWFSIVGVSVILLGFCAFAVFALAHHAAPAGGGV